MLKAKEIIRLRQEAKLSYRAIARACSVRKDTVRDHLCRVSEAGLSWPLPEELSEEALERQLYPIEINLGGKRTLPDWPEIHQELRRKCMIRPLLSLKRLGFDESEGCVCYRYGEHYPEWYRFCI